MDLPTIEFEGQRVLGCLPPAERCGLAEFTTVGAVLPRSEWRDISYRPFKVKLRDQTKYGSCAGMSSTSGFELAAAMAGKTRHDFSPWFLYSQINGGKDQGAMMSDAMTALMSVGVCFDTEVAYGTYLKSKIGQGPYQTAKRFRMENAFRCRSFDEIMSAICSGFPVAFGIPIGSNLGDVDSEGISPPTGSVIGGHAMLGLGKATSTRLREPLLEVQNSWGSKFGKNGFCYLREAHFAKWSDAFAIQVVIDDPQDPHDEPPRVIR